MKKIQLYILTCMSLILFSTNTYGQKDNNFDGKGTFLGLGLGTWLPVGNDKTLGNPAHLRIGLDSKLGKSSLGFGIDAFLGNIKEDVSIVYEDMVISPSRYQCFQFVLDYSYELLHKDRFFLGGITSIGYGRLNYFHEYSTGAGRIYSVISGKSSFVFQPGLSFRYYFNDDLYLQFKTQYDFANYTSKVIRSRFNNRGEKEQFIGNHLVTNLTLGVNFW